MEERLYQQEGSINKSDRYVHTSSISEVMRSIEKRQYGISVAPNMAEVEVYNIEERIDSKDGRV